MGRAGYQALGFAVWKGAKWYLHRRFGDTPRRLALGGIVVAVVAALVLAGKRAASE